VGECCFTSVTCLMYIFTLDEKEELISEEVLPNNASMFPRVDVFIGSRLNFAGNLSYLAIIEATEDGNADISDREAKEVAEGLEKL
jgi:hypothetical protein